MPLVFFYTPRKHKKTSGFLMFSGGIQEETEETNGMKWANGIQPHLTVKLIQSNLSDVRHERHECNSNDTSATRVKKERHECDTSATRTTRVRHECYTIDTSVTRVKNFAFDNDTSENTFSQPQISYIANERLQGEEQFHFKNYLLEMPCFTVKMHLKSLPQKLKFIMTKAISRSYALDCSCKCP